MDLAQGVKWYRNDQSNAATKRRHLILTAKNYFWPGGRLSSVVLSAPTILWPWVQIPSKPSKLFSICIIEIVMRRG